MIKTLKHLGFTVEYVALIESWKLSRNNIEITHTLFSEGAAWTRAAALAGLIDPMNSFMIHDALLAAQAISYTLSYNFAEKQFMATIFDKDNVMHHFEHRVAMIAFTTVFENFIDYMEKQNGS